MRQGRDLKRIIFIVLVSFFVGQIVWAEVPSFSYSQENLEAGLRKFVTQLEENLETVMAENISLLEQNARLTVKLNQAYDDRDELIRQIEHLRQERKFMGQRIEVLRGVRSEPEFKLKDLMTTDKGEEQKPQTLKEAFQKLLEANKDNERLQKETMTMHYNLGNLFFEQKKYPQAAIEYKKTLKLPKAQYNLAIIYDYYIKDYPQAINYYRGYLKLEPNLSEKNKIEKRIAELNQIIKVF